MQAGIAAKRCSGEDVVGSLAIGIRILRRVLEVRLLDPPSGAFRIVQVLYL